MVTIQLTAVREGGERRRRTITEKGRRGGHQAEIERDHPNTGAVGGTIVEKGVILVVGGGEVILQKDLAEGGAAEIGIITIVHLEDKKEKRERKHLHSEILLNHSNITKKLI